MVLINTWEDSITYLVHKKYQQYYKGLKVEGAIYNENSLNGNVINSNGFIAENLNKNSTPSVSDSLALNYALSYLNASKYAWEDDSLEYYLNLDSMSTDSTLFPRGELIWAIKGSRNIIDTNYVLCWKFKIWTLNPKDIIQYIYVCANTGQIISTRNISVNGTFNHIYYGTQSIDTRWFGGLRNKFYLKANDDGHNIFTKDENFHKSWTDTDCAKNNSDNWGNMHWAATASHWAVEQSWNYWKNVWGINGTNGKGKAIRVHANYGEANAEFIAGGDENSYDQIKVGVLDLGLAATPDMVGHEFAHGVTFYFSGLWGDGDQGQINESYSDIFGLLTERNVFPSNWDWTIGEDCTNFARRDMSNPKNTTPNDPYSCLPATYPSYYQESNSWFNGNNSCDFGGIHHNLSVQNKCFFLLSQGGNQLGISVSGIGITKASLIAQRALVVYVQELTTWQQNREAWIAAAIDLFGRCSFEHLQTCRAWAACNIGSTCYCLPNPNPNICLDINLRYPIDSPEIAPMNIQNVESKKHINILPNPTNSTFTINVENEFFYHNENTKIHFIIYDNLGREILKDNFRINEIKNIYIEDYDSGIYTIIMQFPDTIVTRKIIKTNQ